MIQGAVGASFNSEGIYQSGSALRHLVIQNAVNGFKGYVEKEMGLPENVTLKDCEVCLSAAAWSSHRISFRESSLKNGSMMLIGGGLDLRNTSMENLNLNQSSATLMNRVQESSIKNSNPTLSQGLQSSGNNDNTPSSHYRRERNKLMG